MAAHTLSTVVDMIAVVYLVKCPLAKVYSWVPTVLSLRNWYQMQIW